MWWGNNRLGRLSVDNLGNQVVALIGLRCDRLEQSTLITFGYRIRTQPQLHVLGMGQRFNSLSRNLVHLFNQVENAGEICGVGIDFCRVDANSGEMGYALDVVFGYWHG